MTQTVTLTLDRLPPPPELKGRAPTLGDVINDGLTLLGELGAALQEFEVYNKKLSETLNAVCAGIERPDANPDDLARLSGELLKRERDQARTHVPILEVLAEGRERATKLDPRRFPFQFRRAFEELFDTFEQIIAGELEIYRDTRLRVDQRRAEIINRAAGEGKVFDSGKAAAAHLRSLRRR